MATFHFSSEVINVSELFQLTKEKTTIEGVSLSLSREELAKSGERPLVTDVLALITTASVTDAVLKGVITVLIKAAYDKLIKIAYAEPHILIRYVHGGKRKIMYDKSPAEIAEELISIVSKGGITRIEFNS